MYYYDSAHGEAIDKRGEWQQKHSKQATDTATNSLL